LESVDLKIIEKVIYGIKFLRSNGLATFIQAVYFHFFLKGKQVSNHQHYEVEFKEVFSESAIKQESTDKSFDFVVIIPIFNGIQFITRLKKSLESCPKLSLLLIDDGSNEPETISFIENWSKEENVSLIKNEVNMGFPATVNKAIAAIQGDFILLNSDTEVYGDWAQKLVTRLHSNKQIAAVTPFSNAATIFSWPEPYDQKMILPLKNIQEMATLNVTNERFPAPSINGFCVAIKRSAWEKVGEFDSATFKVGYGEENDWSMRARGLGYTVELAPDVFVYHYHGGSFNPEVKKQRLKDSGEVLKQKYPNYEKEVRDHINENPWKGPRFRIEFELALRNPINLFVSHGIGGGAEVWLRQELKAHADIGSSQLLLTPGSAGNVNVTISHTVISGLRQFTIKNFPITELFSHLEDKEIIEVTVNSLVGWRSPQELLVELNKLSSIRYIAHDYFGICPSYNLINDKGNFCGVPNTQECVRCIPNNQRIHTDIPENKVESWRQTLIESISKENSKFVYFSEDSLLWHLRAGIKPSNLIFTQPKYTESAGNHSLNRKKRNSRIQIAFVGHINYAKGSHVVRDLVSLTPNSELEVDFHLIGELRDTPKPKGNFQIHGAYSRDELPGLLEKLEIDLALVPSIWPETYNIVADEVLAAGIPLIVSPLGAMKERFKGNSMVKVAEGTDSQSYFKAIAEMVLRLK
jgi:GT2 family glycosyltransferase/glycosyltransferase involved in cell wall biosynthesis